MVSQKPEIICNTMTAAMIGKNGNSAMMQAPTTEVRMIITRGPKRSSSAPPWTAMAITRIWRLEMIRPITSGLGLSCRAQSGMITDSMMNGLPAKKAMA